MECIYHITSEKNWATAQAQGFYNFDALKSEGFIHCSNQNQVFRVANFLFKGRADLVLLHLDPGQLVPPLKYENLEGGDELFPHIYGILNLEAVVMAAPFKPGPQGDFTVPFA